MTATVLRDDALTSTDDGFELRVGLPWIRSLPLASLDEVEVAVDGEPVTPLAVVLEGRTVDPTALGGESVWWFLQDRVALRGGRMLRPGRHDVAVSFRLTVPYLQGMPEGPLALPLRIQRSLVLNGAASAPTVSRDVA